MGFVDLSVPKRLDDECLASYNEWLEKGEMTLARALGIIRRFQSTGESVEALDQAFDLVSARYPQTKCLKRLFTHCKVKGLVRIAEIYSHAIICDKSEL